VNAQVRATPDRDPGSDPGRRAGSRSAGDAAAGRRRVDLGRLAVFGAVLTLLVAADAAYMHVTGYQPEDRHRFGLSDAGEMTVAACLLAVVTLALLGLRRQAGSGRS